MADELKPIKARRDVNRDYKEPDVIEYGLFGREAPFRTIPKIDERQGVPEIPQDPTVDYKNTGWALSEFPLWRGAILGDKYRPTIAYDNQGYAMPSGYADKVDLLWNYMGKVPFMDNTVPSSNYYDRLNDEEYLYWLAKHKFDIDG